MTITSEDRSEAAIWAEGTQYATDDIIRALREHRRLAVERGDTPLSVAAFCETVLEISPQSVGSQYHVAFVKADGSWDIVEAFTAADNYAANAYAEQHYADREWYVLNANGDNINGGAA